MRTIINGWRRLEKDNPVLAQLGAAHLVLGGAFLTLGLVDQRMVLGENVWIKPVKFAFSGSAYLLAMAWYLGRLRAGRKWKGAATAIVGATITLEVLLIAMQAARGTTSHFNNSSGFDGAVFSLMGLLIAANTAVVAAVAWRFFRRAGVGEDLASRPGLLWGARLGLVLFLLGSLEGGMMIGLGRHSVGMPDGGAGLPLVHWNTQAGDLRIAHFMGLHALQALPIAAWLLRRFGGLRGAAPVATAAALYFLGFNLLFLQALAGRPLLRL